MALTQISTKGIKDGTITGTDLATNVDLVDNQKLRLGTSQDLEIYHDGTASFISNTTGDLKIDSDNIKIRQSNGDAFIKCQSTAVELYFADNKKFETTNTGVSVTGQFASTGAIIIDDGTNARITLTSDSATNARILATTTGFAAYTNLEIRSSTVAFKNAGNTQTMTLDASGRLLVGTTTEGFGSFGDKFTIADSGHCGMTIRSGTTNDGNIYFSDGTSGVDEVRGFVEYKHSNNSLNLGTNAATRLSIASDGKLTHTYNIGTNGDEGLVLNTNDGTKASSILFKANNENRARIDVQRLSGDGGQLKIQVAQMNNTNTMLDAITIAPTSSGDTTPNVTLSGNLYVGTATADGMIHARVDAAPSTNFADNNIAIATGNQYIHISNSNTTGIVQAGIVMNAAGSASAVGAIYVEKSNSYVGSMIFRMRDNVTTSKERMRINPSGFVCIGTTDNIIFNHGATGDDGIVLGPDGAIQVARTGDQCMILNRRGTDGTVLSFHNDGACVGFISVSGATTSYSPNCSDRTLKKNFGDWTENTLSLFKDLTPQTFNFLMEQDTDTKHKGFIAQNEVDKFPEAYPKNDDKYWFDPMAMVPYLMKAIQELEAEVAALKAN